MLNNPSRSPDVSAIERVAGRALQSKSVDVEKLSGYLYRTYRLTTTRGFFYILRAQPSHHYKLLRHEENRISTEAGALQILSGRSDLSNARVIEYANTKAHIGSYYLITGPYTGSVLADVEPSLSAQALYSIDKSLGMYVRRLSAIPGTTFGPIRESQRQPGHSTWSRAFAALLETVLRDGEDALINLPYDGMRELVRRHRSSLDKITQPRLFLIEMSADENVVVDTKTNSVTGILDFSTAFWGDRYMSDCFYQAKRSFADGFGRLPNGDVDECIRQYLYVMYHALLQVVIKCYRPSAGDKEVEMKARRDLTTSIRHLTSVSSR
ncbi:hypothetical protein EJ03DRAFT_374560 [Teratosphaeria nubilosa]|uniref:Aminoglycoside phosphotransferase domain-containing protein n=1 Tax=Teratosphaeria nubilosa TaxID=161662 RepID=A0A6G1L984_9PEZI|nr:hypothetical protein EJ03DRAFT_374560 [Teratosphaeria nubilosa]